MKTFSKFESENLSTIDFNIYSLRGLIIYICLCYLAIFRLIISRNNFNRIIILDCEYSSLSILFILLYILGWEGKITVQVNAPNFNYSYRYDGFNFFRILKFIQSYIFKYSLNLLPIKISCLGIWHKRKLAKQLSFDKNKIFVIEDGGGGLIKKIPRNFLIKKLESSAINFPKGNKKIFLLFGNMRKDKGHLFLPLIWERYFGGIDDPYLWIVGNDEQGICEHISKSISKNIIVHNSYLPYDLISAVYQTADFAILPYMSNYSGGSGPLMKGAFTHSKLALVANVSEMGRLAKEERLAEYFHPEDTESVICCIKRVLLNGEDYYSDKIKMANKYANERDWSNLSKKFIKSLI